MYNQKIKVFRSRKWWQFWKPKVIIKEIEHSEFFKDWSKPVTKDIKESK